MQYSRCGEGNDAKATARTLGGDALGGFRQRGSATITTCLEGPPDTLDGRCAGDIKSTAQLTRCGDLRTVG